MAQLASTIATAQLSQDLITLCRCLLGTALPFALSSLAVEVVAVSLATLENHTKLRRWFPFAIVCHLLPLLVAPVLFANLLTTYVESLPNGLEWAQSAQFVALFGFLFHTFLAYIVLTRVFMWANRVDRARRLVFNNSRWSVMGTIYSLELAAPLVFTFAMVFVFQESMISVPLFTGRPTLLSVAQSIMKDATSLPYSWIVAVCLIATAGVFLIVSYQAPRLAARWTLSFLARRAHPDLTTQATNHSVATAFVKVLTPVCAVVVFVSVVVHASVVAVVLKRLFLMARGASLSQTGPAWASLASPALQCGAFLSVILLITVLVSTKRGFKPAFRPLRSLALIPPALIGTAGLLCVVGRVSQYAIAYALLLAYSYVLLRFFVSDAELASDRVLLHNAKLLRFRFSRRSLVVLLSAVGGVFLPALLAFYFLWIEDGVQVTILTSGDNLASLVRGLRQARLIAGTYYGVMVVFSAWVILFLGVWLMTRLRYHFFAWRLRKLLSTTALVLLAVLALTDRAIAQTGGNVSSGTTSSCEHKVAIIAAGAEYNITDRGCGIIRFDEVTLQGSAGSLRVDAPDASVEISKLNLLRAGATLRIDGILGQKVRELSVRSVALPTAGSMDRAQIEFGNANIGRLTVNGLKLENANNPSSGQRPTVNLIIQDSSSAEVIEVHKLISPELRLRLANSGHDSVHFEGVSSASLQITSSPKRANGGSIEGDVTLEGRPGQRPLIAFDSVQLRNLRLAIEGSSGADIRLSNIQTEPQANAVFLLNISGGRVNIHLEDITLGGPLQLQASARVPIYSVTMYGLARATRSPISIVTVGLRSMNLSRLVLKELEIDGLDLCQSSVQNSAPDDIDVENISVTDEIVIPSELMQLLSFQGSDTVSRVRFLKMLQEHGRFCDSKELIGIQALYSRKRAELLSLHPFAGWVIDRMTGLGVDITKPFVTFLGSFILYLLLRIILLFLALKPTDNGRFTWRASRSVLGEAIWGCFFALAVPHQHQLFIQRALDSLRLLFGWFVFVQITLCSIYLSQTTLQ